MAVLERYAALLGVTERTPRLSLGEGATPLIDAGRLGASLGIDLHLKVEGQNPTGSFKDRGMVLAVAKALEEGSEAVICASTGNTSASAAAYAAHAGIRAAVVVPAGRIALGKLAQAVMHGARVAAIDGNFDDALRIVRKLAAQGRYTLVNSLNPWRIEGQQTAAFEVVEALRDAPEVVALPVGNAGNITAYARGFKLYHALGRASRRPRLYGVQATGAAPLVTGLRVASPETVASAIRVGDPAGWQSAVAAVEGSCGGFCAVTDDEILRAQEFLARETGVFAEPASAAAIAGLVRLRREGALPRGAKVVAVLTGTGLKDPAVALCGADEAVRTVPADVDAVAEAIAL